MSDDKRPRSFQRLTAAAVAIGLGIGGYGLAAAASGTGSSAAPSAAATTTVQQMPDPGGRHGWGGQRSDETPLTGDALAKVRAAALAKVPGATIERVETDADGHAKYEAHIVKPDGTLATVYVNEQFAVVSVETR